MIPRSKELEEQIAASRVKSEARREAERAALGEIGLRSKWGPAIRLSAALELLGLSSFEVRQEMSIPGIIRVAYLARDVSSNCGDAHTVEVAVDRGDADPWCEWIDASVERVRRELLPYRK